MVLETETDSLFHLNVFYLLNGHGYGDLPRGIFGHVDFLGIGALSLKDDEKFRPIVDAHEDVSFVIISDLWLDHPKTLPALRRVFEGYSMTDFRPYAFIFCGNFSVKGWEGASSIPSYTAGFKNLADLIASFPTLASHSNFLFLPGPTDPWSSATLPRPAIPDNFTKYLRDKVPKVTFTSNPARIRYFGQEIVLFREDLMGRMLRNLVSVKDQTEGSDMKRYVSWSSSVFYFDRTEPCSLIFLFPQSPPALWGLF